MLALWVGLRWGQKVAIEWWRNGPDKDNSQAVSLPHHLRTLDQQASLV